MSSLIANKIKTNTCLVSIKLSLLSALSSVPLLPTYTTYTTITTAITACSLFFSHNYSVYCSKWRYSNRDCFVHTQLHTGLTKFLLLTVCPLCFDFLYIHAFIINIECQCSCSKLLSVQSLVYLCSKLIIVIAKAFVYCFHVK